MNSNCIKTFLSTHFLRNISLLSNRFESNVPTLNKVQSDLARRDAIPSSKLDKISENMSPLRILSQLANIAPESDSNNFKQEDFYIVQGDTTNDARITPNQTKYLSNLYDEKRILEFVRKQSVARKANNLNQLGEKWRWKKTIDLARGATGDRKLELTKSASTHKNLLSNHKSLQKNVDINMPMIIARVKEVPQDCGINAKMILDGKANEATEQDLQETNVSNDATCMPTNSTIKTARQCKVITLNIEPETAKTKCANEKELLEQLYKSYVSDRKFNKAVSAPIRKLATAGSVETSGMPKRYN